MNFWSAAFSVSHSFSAAGDLVASRGSLQTRLQGEKRLWMDLRVSSMTIDGRFLPIERCCSFVEQEVRHGINR